MSSEDNSCLICLGECEFAVKMECQCNTRFCQECLVKWLLSSSTCPLCRQPSKIVPLYTDQESCFQAKIALGYQKIAEAELGGFENKQLLKDALRLGLGALLFDPSGCEAYVLIAYLTLLVGQVSLAKRYLEKGLSFDPSNEDANRLYEYAKNKPVENDEPTPVSTDSSPISKNKE